jgi:hypothetical protein
VDHAEIIKSCNAKAEGVGLAELTPAERTVVLVSWAHFEVELGGLSAYFYNSAGDHAAETVTALGAVGAVEAATALKAAMARFPGGSPPVDRERRATAWRAVSESLDPLDDEFGRDHPDVFSRLCAFMSPEEDGSRQAAPLGSAAITAPPGRIACASR